GGDEGDLGAAGVERRGRPVSRHIQRRARLASFSMRARRIAGRYGAKGLGDLGQDRRRPGVVQIDPQRSYPLLWSGWWISSFSVPWKLLRYRWRSRISSTLMGSAAATGSATGETVVVSISSTAPPAIASTTMNVTWHCAHVTWRWKRSSSWLSTCTSQPFKLRPQTGQL